MFNDMFDKIVVMRPRATLGTEDSVVSANPKKEQQEKTWREEHDAEANKIGCILGNTQTGSKRGLERRDDNTEKPERPGEDEDEERNLDWEKSPPVCPDP
jgi:hypothetical protein